MKGWPEFQLCRFSKIETMESPAFVASLVSKDPFLYESLPKEMKNKIVIIEAMLKNKPFMFHYIPDEFKSNDRLIKIVLEQNPWLFISLPEKMKTNIDYVKMALKGWRDIDDISHAAKALLIIYHEIVPIELRDNIECISLGLKSILSFNNESHKKIFKLVPESVKNNDDFMINVIFKQCKMYDVSNCISKKQKNDVLFMRRLLEQHGSALQNAENHILNDLECLSSAFLNWPSNFFSIRSSLHKTKHEKYEKIYSRQKTWLEHAMDVWRKNDKALLHVVQKAPISLFEAVANLCQLKENILRIDKKVIEAILKRHGSFLLRCPNNMQNDESLVKIAVSSYPGLLQHLPHHLRDNPSVVLIAIKNLPHTIQYAGDTALMDQSCIDVLTNKHGSLSTCDNPCPNAHTYNTQEWFSSNRSNFDTRIGRHYAVAMWMTDFDKIVQIIAGCPFAELQNIVDTLFFHHNYEHDLDHNLLKLIGVIINRHTWLLQHVHTYLEKKYPAWIDWDDQLKMIFRGIVLGAVKIAGGVLSLTFDDLKDNNEIVEAAIINDPDAYQFASLRLQQNMRFVDLALKGGAAFIVMKHLPSSLYTFDNFTKIFKADHHRQVYHINSNSRHFSGVGQLWLGKTIKEGDDKMASSLYNEKHRLAAINKMPCLQQAQTERSPQQKIKDKISQLHQEIIISSVQYFQLVVGRSPPSSVVVKPFNTSERFNYARIRVEKSIRQIGFMKTKLELTKIRRIEKNAKQL